MTLVDELYLSVEICKMTDDPNQRRILFDRARHIMDRPRQGQCWHDEFCTGTPKGHCQECGGDFCANHMEGKVHGRHWCHACFLDYELEMERQYAHEYDGPRMGEQ